MRAFRLLLPLALLLAACQPTQAPPALAPVATASPLDPSTGAATSPRPPAALPPASPTPAPSASPTAGPSAVPSPAPSAALRLAAVGASDVFGLGADDPATQNWAAVAAGLVDARVDGDVALARFGVLNRMADEMVRFDLPRAVAAKPQVAALWTGANDIRTGVTLDDFRQDLDALIDGLAATGAKVYVLNLPDLDRLPFFAEYKESYAQVVPVWQEAIRAEGQAHGATVIDLEAYSAEIDAHPEYLWADGFHPSTAGYARLGAIVAEAIAKDLPAGR